jgi:predicted RNA-binding protein with PIN domain
MSYLIDGNNVMAQRVGWHRDKSAARRKLMEDVAVFARIKKVRVSLVFDGAPEEFFADGSSYKGVKIFYARQNSNADERIKLLVESSKERRTLIVVTSDRALSDYCRHCGARVIRSGEFRQMIDEARLKNENVSQSPGEGVKENELSSWMRYFGVDESDDE